MTHELDQELRSCAEAFSAMNEMMPGLIKKVYNAKYVLDQAKAQAYKDICREAEEKGAKKPTEEAIKSAVTLAVATEMKDVKDAEEAMDAAKAHIDTLRYISSITQSRTSLFKTEVSIATAGGFGN